MEYGVGYNSIGIVSREWAAEMDNQFQYLTESRSSPQSNEIALHILFL
jgi:hypothetical protein